MYRLIIVDDEEMVRNGLMKYFDWASIGFEIVGLFEDGRDAISFLQHEHTDAVLTDIKMFEVSGIELARYTSEHCPRTKVVFLSGYKDFEFARDSIKYGVCDYILKPVNMQEIRLVFVRVREILDKEVRESETASTLPFAFCNGQLFKEIQACNRSLVAVVVAGDIDGVYSYHEQLFSMISGTPPEFVFFIISSLLEELYIRFNRMGIHLDDRLKKEKVLSRLDRVETAELFSQTGKVLLEFCEYLSSKKDIPGESMVIQAKKYIIQHLYVSFSIEDVARSVFLSASYFSREFKDATGENVIDYIIKCRMDYAINLIKENQHNIAEISTMSGYNDSKYFHRCFKKYTGYTVKEFQKLLH